MYVLWDAAIYVYIISVPIRLEGDCCNPSSPVRKLHGL